MLSRKKERKGLLGPPNLQGIEQGQKFYNTRYQDEYSVETLIPVYEAVLGLIRKLKNQDLNILDIGCGQGDFAGILKENGFTNYQGFDFSEVAVQKAWEKVPDWYDRFRTGDCYKLNELNIKYDLSIALEVLEHIRDLELVSQLAPGTHFIGSVPNYWASDNAHLRVYPGKFFIWRRYYKYLKIIHWKKHYLKKHRFITVFLARVR